MLLIGITGGIGSGKTTVAKMFAERGVPIYIADERAKLVMERPEVIQRVQALFEENVLTKEGHLDRKVIRSIVFKDKEKLEQMNSVIHPEVRRDFTDWVEQEKGATFVLKESAILFEQGLDKDCDYVIFVKAPVDVRIARVIQRDGVTSERVQEIINNQMDEAEKERRSDFIIENIDRQIANNQVESLCQSLKRINNEE